MSNVQYRDVGELEAPVCCNCGRTLYARELKARNGIPGTWCSKCFAEHEEAIRSKEPWAQYLSSQEVARRARARRVFKYAAEEGVPVEATTRGAITEADAGLAYVWAERTI